MGTDGVRVYLLTMTFPPPGTALGPGVFQITIQGSEMLVAAAAPEHFGPLQHLGILEGTSFKEGGLHQLQPQPSCPSKIPINPSQFTF